MCAVSLPLLSLQLSQSESQKPQPWLPSTSLLCKYPTLTHLNSCKTFKQINQIHAQTITTGIFHDNFVASRILSFYALSPCASLSHALQLFFQIRKPDPFMINTLIRAFAHGPNPHRALLFYTQILQAPLYLHPDSHTFPLLLKACSEIPSLGQGKSLHSQVLKFGCSSLVSIQNFLVQMYASCGDINSAKQVFNEIFELDDASWNVMLGGYSKCGLLNLARQLFDEMPQRDVVSWSVIINGCVQNNCFKEGLELFSKMLADKLEPNESVLVNVLSACAHLGAFEQGTWVESYVRKNNFRVTVRLGTALIDMYSKCGFAEKAVEVFQRMEEKNVMSWSAMIGGLAINGHGKAALELFSQMEMERVKPNEVTFISILNACSHSGLVDEGSSYFYSMKKVYGLEANAHHYCCMVDLYGRAGQLDQAEELIKTMPMKPNSAVWGALLNACRIHQNAQLGERVGQLLIELEPHHSGRYILLSNIYAAQGRWDDVAELRRVMRERGISKTPGSSFIESKGTVHEFVAGDISHPRSEEIYAKLEEMSRELKAAGYKPDTSQVLIDMDEEEKETALCHHSEKLAIAFALITSDSGSQIRITKNLRVCADCHSATKLLSKVYDREIVVRDRMRFHHFRRGSCSCLDFW